MITEISGDKYNMIKRFLYIFLICVCFVFGSCGCSEVASEEEHKIINIRGINIEIIPSVYENNLKKLDNIQNFGEEITNVYISVSGDEEKRNRIMDEIKCISDEICIGADNDLEKAKRISKWTAENLSYDRDRAANGVDTELISLESILYNGYRSTCGGHANMVSALCAAQGIYCVNLRGGTVSSGNTHSDLANIPTNHEWNGVYIDKKWYFLNSTWASERYYENGEYGNDGSYLECYELFGFDEMSAEHRIDIAEQRFAEKK